MSIVYRAHPRNHKGLTINSHLWKPFNFPAGEIHMNWSEEEDILYALWEPNPDVLHDELMELVTFADIQRSLNKPVHVYSPYFPGARADRGTPFGAGIYSDMMNLMVKPDSVTVLDPHSPVITSLLQNVRTFPVEEIIRKTFENTHSFTGVIAPDKGAISRATTIAEILNVPLYKAEKVRDFQTGKLTGFKCEPLPNESVSNYLVVDDICDGGGTFMGLAETTKLPKEKLSLWVTHGVFSKNADKLPRYFGKIYTTSSMDTSPDYFMGRDVLEVIPVEPFFSNDFTKNLAQ